MSRIVILGGGESGVGSAVLAKVKGFDVFLSDMGKISDEYVQMLEKWEIPFEQGCHTEDLILNADEVIKSPGIGLSPYPYAVCVTSFNCERNITMAFASSYHVAVRRHITSRLRDISLLSERIKNI